MKSIKRLITPPAESFFLFGPRGTGKSTWLEMVYPKALKIDLLDSATFRAYRAHPERLADLIAANPAATTVVVDEVQKVPEILDVVHQIMERRKDIQFALTGSSVRKLRRAGVNLLGGRALKLSMPPFVARELHETFRLDDALVRGMLPVVYRSTSPLRKLEAYLNLYIREEIQQEGLIRNLDSFARFLEAISFSHASLLSISAIARECGVKRTTVDGYVAILRDLLIADIVPVFAKRAKRKLVSHGKFYFFDTGVWRTLRPKGPLDRPAEIDGAALEGLVYQHLRAKIDLENEGGGLYFWRTRSGVEVDFVIYTPRSFMAVEVKNTVKVQPADIAGLRAFVEDYPEATPVLVYRGCERIMFNGVTLIPATDFLLSL
ncbi:MAG: ATP-binding protein [Kiritimatiellae bacterium]|nr:ATP-binding protein [Kiritimatiellia bacterium]MBP5320365.1 ATP-binding protein [Kiritimatiellia bacterium]